MPSIVRPMNVDVAKGAMVERDPSSGAAFTFNDLLHAVGIDVNSDRVRLVRHHDTRKRSPTVYAVWKSPGGTERVEAYQRLQRRDVFEVGDLLASFVVTPRPRADTLFIGLFRVNGRSTAPRGTTDPIYDNDASGVNLYDIARDARLNNYVDRLVVDWGPGPRSWIQTAKRQPKPVLAIRDPSDPRFPGFTQFYCDTDEVLGLYPTWQEILRNVKGVYLLVDKDSGEQYIGSAKGDDSLLGRFMSYAETNHGGNVELRRRGKRRYRVSVLEVVDTRLPDDRIEQIEAAWKAKLMTKDFGLNKN